MDNPEERITNILDELKTLLNTSRTPGRQKRIVNAIWRLDEQWRKYLAMIDQPSG